MKTISIDHFRLRSYPNFYNCSNSFMDNAVSTIAAIPKSDDGKKASPF